MKKCPSSIWCWDSNSWPLEHESPPIITRPGLRPIQMVVCSNPSDAYLLYGWLILALICWKNVWMLEKMENKQKEAGMAHVRRCWPDGLIIFSKFGYLQQWTFTQLHKNYQRGSKLCCLRLNKPSNNCKRLDFCCRRWRNFAKSDHTGCCQLGFLFISFNFFQTFFHRLDTLG